MRMRNRSRAWVALLTVLASALMVHTAHALLLDDFSDGNADGWSESSLLITGGPAIFDATSGRYEMASTGIVLDDESGMTAIYDALPPDLLHSIACRAILTPCHDYPTRQARRQLHG